MSGFVVTFDDITELLSAQRKAAWADVAEPLRPAAALTLAAHLDKLSEEGRLPGDVRRPAPPADCEPAPSRPPGV